MASVRKSILLSITAPMIAIIAFNVNADIAVVGNSKIAAKVLPTTDVKKYWLSNKKRFPDGTRVHVADQKRSSSISKVFYEKVLGKSPAQAKAYWAKVVFSDRGKPPVALQDDAEVKKWVAKTSGGLGYIDIKSVDSATNVLLILK